MKAQPGKRLVEIPWLRFRNDTLWAEYRRGLRRSISARRLKEIGKNWEPIK